MKKILAIFEGTKYSDNTSKYAIDMAKRTGSMLVGVFIYDTRFTDYAYTYTFDQPFIGMADIERAHKEDFEKIDLNIKLFNSACNEKGVHHKVHLDKGVPIHEVVRESAFADIVIIDSHTSLYGFGDVPGHSLKEILADAHCPVLVVPVDYRPYKKVIICYDGQPSSVYAIKMFAYLFPELGQMKYLLVSVNEAAGNHVKEGSNLKELMKQHFGDTDFLVLKGKPQEELMQLLNREGDDAIVVMGAYGKSAFSRLFHQSLSSRIIKETGLPVFITHQ
ncbi:MAG: universal stress protein [Chitinophagales bacterium]|nr:universal stress protein [Chitinophagales bacterium]